MYLSKYYSQILLCFCLLGSFFLVNSSQTEQSLTSVSIRSNESYKFVTSQYITHDPISVSFDSELEAISSSGNGTIINPFIIEHWEIKSESPSLTGINITGTTKYFIIRNCLINTTGIGIYLESVNASTATIFNNTCTAGVNYWQADTGIKVINSKNITLENNICIGKGTGIYVEGSHNSYIKNNTCYDNEEGIIIELSDGSTLFSNIVAKTHSHDAIHTIQSSNLTIYNNTMAYNQGVGLSIELGDFNLIYHNIFFKNGKTPQAEAALSNSTWYNPDISEGNYWSDYAGSGNYAIEDNYFNGEDLFPLTTYPWTSISAPTIISPITGDIIVGGATISWKRSLYTIGIYAEDAQYIIYYSSDAGETWNEIVQLDNPGYLWDTSTVEDGDKYCIKIVAESSEGLKAENVSGVFTITNKVEYKPNKPNDEFILIALVGGIIAILIGSIFIIKGSITFSYKIGTWVYKDSGKYHSDAVRNDEMDLSKAGIVILAIGAISLLVGIINIL